MKRLKLKIIIPLLFVFLANVNCFGQVTPRQVDSLVAYAMTKFNVAGLAIGIVKDGKIILAKGYGVKSVSTKSPVDAHTDFAIASNSKAFTTAALSILVEEGTINWDDKVKKYIPEFTMYDPYVAENFNIQDLLTHRSGLGLGMGDLMIFPDGSDFTMNDILGSFRHFEPVSAFRTKYDYDNLLYLVAGEVIKRVSGMAWEDFVTKRIFEPLKMDHTYASLAKMIDKSNLSAPHSSETGALVVLPNYADMVNGAAGGIYSNADDLCQWMMVQLNHGKYGSSLEKKLFSPESQHEMWKIHTVIETNPFSRFNSHFHGYGLGWDLSDLKGNLKVEHTGGFPGMLSKTVLIPDINLGVVILTNTSNDGAGVFGSLSNSIVEAYLGMDDFGWIDKYAARFASMKAKGDSVADQVWAAVAKADKSAVNESNYQGMYADKWFGKMEVYKKDDKLCIRSLRSPKLTGTMYFYKANTFAIKWDYRDMECDAFAMFSLDEEGKAQELKMKGISPNIDFSFDFQDLDLHRVK